MTNYWNGDTVEKTAALVVLSGGLDSYVALLFALKSGYKCRSVTFDYGQRNSVEVGQARIISDKYGVENEVVKIQGIISNDEVDFIPCRNVLFVQQAAMVAYRLNCKTLILGFQRAHYIPYPDTTERFVYKMQELIDITSGRMRIAELSAPLIALSKRQVIQLGTAFGAEFKLSTSCGERPVSGRDCGKCGGCQSRNAGFLSAGLVDPTDYAEKPKLND